MYSPLKLWLDVLLETSYYSEIRRTQEGEMRCSKLSARIKTHKEGKRIDDEGNHTFSQETCVCLSERRSNKETLVISNSHRCRFILTRNILVFANFILKQKISNQITLHVLALLGYGCVWNPKLYLLLLWNICLNLFPGRKWLTDL